MISMGKMYEDKMFYSPRLKTDTLFTDCSERAVFGSFVDRNIRYIEKFQLLDPALWARFVRQFSEEDADYNNGWRGEYWGKMMRGACFTYSYTKNKELYRILTSTVCDMICAQEENGRISSYGIHHEFEGWDMWSRKYVILGLQYYMEISEEQELCESIKESISRQLDYIIEHIGPKEEGKKEITDASRHWRGANSCSILEPVMRHYVMTGDKKYLDFAEYIVSKGATGVENLFELAFKRELLPYQFPITKAYEVTSCFDGLLEYYRVCGGEKHRTAVINFADMILESDFTVIGTAGCTHELFDHSTYRQANTTNDRIMQETCVTVTLMKYFLQVHLLTSDVKYADAFERAMYNAYFGAINTEKVIEPSVMKNHPECVLEPMPFDSYSPLTAGTRGNGLGGMQIMSDKHYYGCCACIGSMGNGLIPKMAVLKSREGFVYNLFIDGRYETYSPDGNPVTFYTNTEYPRSGEVHIRLGLGVPESFTLLLRNPVWSKNTEVYLNGEKISCAEGYVKIDRTWQYDDEILIRLDMRTRVVSPVAYGSDILMNKVIWGQNYIVPTFDRQDPLAMKHIALERGPVVLAQDSRLGYSVDEPSDILVDGEYVDAVLSDENAIDSVVTVEVPLKDGSSMTLVDYSSAGKLWSDESRMAAWILVK